MLPIQLPCLVERKGQQMISFPVYPEEDKALPTLYFVDQKTMEVQQKIPEALCLVNFTDDHNLFCAKVKLDKYGDLWLACFIELKWNEHSEQADKAYNEPESGELVDEYEAEAYLS